MLNTSVEFHRTGHVPGTQTDIRRHENTRDDTSQHDAVNCQVLYRHGAGRGAFHKIEYLAGDTAWHLRHLTVNCCVL